MGKIVQLRFVCGGIFTKTREKTENGLFFALRGEAFDGADFALEAVKNGAVAIVCERLTGAPVPHILVENCREALARYASAFYGFACERLRIIAITGTNGKTTTAHILASILREAGKKVGVIGTLGAFYDGIEKPTELTTPDPIALHKLLLEMSIVGVEYVVMEASAHALHYDKLAGLRYAACIFSNLTQDHLDFFPTMQAYENAKIKLFTPELCPIAILNGDDETGRRIGALRGDAPTVYYGLQTPCDCFAIVTNESVYGSECMLNICDKLVRTSIPLLGEYNLYNAMSAALCALSLGIDLSAIAKGIALFKGAKGRLERILEHHGAAVLVDFAHTPDGLEKCLTALKKHCQGRLVCLFGCGGNRDRSKRALMGETVSKIADFAVLTSDNPRYEDPLDIIVEIERGYRRFSTKYVVVPDRERAIDYALDFVAKGDILLVAGKGAEAYQEIMGIKYPFSDKDIIEKISKEKGESFSL